MNKPEICIAGLVVGLLQILLIKGQQIHIPGYIGLYRDIEGLYDYEQMIVFVQDVGLHGVHRAVAPQGSTRSRPMERPMFCASTRPLGSAHFSILAATCGANPAV